MCLVGVKIMFFIIEIASPFFAALGGHWRQRWRKSDLSIDGATAKWSDTIISIRTCIHVYIDICIQHKLSNRMGLANNVNRHVYSEIQKERLKKSCLQYDVEFLSTKENMIARILHRNIHRRFWHVIYYSMIVCLIALIDWGKLEFKKGYVLRSCKNIYANNPQRVNWYIRETESRPCIRCKDCHDTSRARAEEAWAITTETIFANSLHVSTG